MIMIGVSTGQNSTNLIPAVQIKGITTLILIETSAANDKDWSKGISATLKGRNITTQPLILSSTEDYDIEAIIQKINEAIEPFNNQKIYWNIGGGQKPHNLAMFLAYSRRNFKEDVICYANQSIPPSIDLLTQEGSKIIKKTEPISIDLTAKEIFGTYGFTIKPNSGKLIYSKKEPFANYKSKNLMRFKDFRRYFYMASALRSLADNEHNLVLNHDNISNLFKDNKAKIIAQFSDVLKNVLSNHSSNKKTDSIKSIAQNHHSINELTENIIGKLLGNSEKQGIVLNTLFEYQDFVEFNDKELINLLSNYLTSNKVSVDRELIKKIGFNKPADYFEDNVISRVQEQLKSLENYVFEAYANIKTGKEGIKEDIAEYDILLITQWGTAIAIDAKTFDFEYKDIDARFYNLSQAAGAFITFHVVAPYDPEDFNDPYFAQKLKELPIKCKERKMQFYAVADSVNKEVFYAKLNKSELNVIEKEDDCLEINKFEFVLKKLGLLK